MVSESIKACDAVVSTRGYPKKDDGKQECLCDAVGTGCVFTRGLSNVVSGQTASRFLLALLLRL